VNVTVELGQASLFMEFDQDLRLLKFNPSRVSNSKDDPTDFNGKY